MKLNVSSLMLGVVLSAAASLNAQVHTDFDHSASFASFRTYSWMKVQAGNSLWDDRLKQDIDAQLALKGWTKVNSGGDAVVSAFRRTQDQQTLETLYDGFGGFGGFGGFRGGGFGGFGLATTTTEVTKVGNVVIDIFDANTKKLVWRGSDSDDLSSNSEKNIEKLQKDIDKMFKHFPPK
jgi:hypothetical protein